MAVFKPSIILADVIEPTHSRPIRLRIVFMIAVGVLLIPLAAEAAVLCYYQWCEVTGGATSEAQTPIIDSIGQGLEMACDSLAESIAPQWHAATRNPYVALPVWSVLIVLAMAMLRR
jgi:hypothetical protein